MGKKEEDKEGRREGNEGGRVEEDKEGRKEIRREGGKK